MSVRECEGLPKFRKLCENVKERKREIVFKCAKEEGKRERETVCVSGIAPQQHIRQKQLKHKFATQTERGER